MAYHRQDETGGFGDFLIFVFLIGMVLVIIVPLFPIVIAVALFLSPFFCFLFLVYAGAKGAAGWKKRRYNAKTR